MVFGPDSAGSQMRGRSRITTAPGGSRGRMRQAQGLSISLDRHSRDLGIEPVDELNIERRRDLPDIG